MDSSSPIIEEINNTLEDGSSTQKAFKSILKGREKKPKNANVQFSSEVQSVSIKRVSEEQFEKDLKSKRRKMDGIEDESTDLLEMFPSSSNVDEYGRLLVEKTQHTLESDEEDDKDPDTSKYDVNKLGCMEERTIKYDGDIKISAFNMDEELEEGDFDKQGNFVYNAEKKGEDDAWEKSIDWEKIAREEKERTDDDIDDDQFYDKQESSIDFDFAYKSVEKTIQKLKSNQTVNKYLIALQNKRPTPAEERKLRYECKRKNISYVDPSKSQIDEMTTLAQPFIDAGIADFDTTKEKLQDKLNAYNNKVDMFN